MLEAQDFAPLFFCVVNIFLEVGLLFVYLIFIIYL